MFSEEHGDFIDLLWKKKDLKWLLIQKKLIDFVTTKKNSERLEKLNIKIQLTIKEVSKDINILTQLLWKTITEINNNTNDSTELLELQYIRNEILFILHRSY